MPKPSKLHVKGKANSMQKALNKKEGSSPNDSSPEDAVQKFQLELCWCIQQLERNITTKKGTEKELQETWKVLHVLKNNNQPMIRKRQLMRSYFGDYRAKMQAEEKKLVKMANKMKITDKSEAKATFLRKSVFQTTGDNSFRFDFKLASDQLDNIESTGHTESGDSLKNGNTEVCNTSALDNSNQNNNSSVKESGDCNETSVENRNFKFTFSGANFKFNFDVNRQINQQ